jgi:SHS family lactate transporter-like MFS transporter
MALLSDLAGLDRSQKSAVAASFLGWTLDAFDFFLMVFMFKAIAHEFHADIEAVVVAGTLTLAARPFGALVFGMLADRFGRRPVLMIDILLYSVLEFASAFAPTLAVLLILRTLFGFAMGGEWGVGASLTMESIPPKLRGMISGLLQEGYAFGYLLAAAVFYFLFDRIGWRGMFMVGIIPALLIIFIRLGVKESPAFEAHRAAMPKRNPMVLLGISVLALAVATAPSLLGAIDKAAITHWIAASGGPAVLGDIARTLSPVQMWIYFIDAPIALLVLFLLFHKHWKIALYVVALMTAFNFFSHGTQDLYPTFLQVQHKLDTKAVGLITAIMNVGAITGGLFFGAWSEKLGRRKAIIIAVLLSLPIIPLWAFGDTFAHGMAGLVLLTVGAFAMQVMVQGAWGIIPVHLNELSPAMARGVFPGFAYQVGNLLASGNFVLQTHLAVQHGGAYGFALAAVAGVTAIIIVLLTAFGPEKRGVDFAKKEAIVGEGGG